MTHPEPEPFWWTTVARDARAAVEPRERTDVAIIGAGYTGVSAARELARRGAAVDVFDAHAPGWGASTRNGGMMLVGMSQRPSALFARFGSELGRRLFEYSREANRHVEETLTGNAIACDYVRAGYLEAAYRPEHMAELAHHAEFVEREFGMRCELVDGARLGGEIDSPLYHGGLVENDSAALNPARFFRGLATLAEQAGARLHADAPILAVERDGGGFSLRAGARRLRAREVLVATNGYTPHFLRHFRHRILAFPTWVILTEALDPALASRLIPRNRSVVDTKHLFYYFRRTSDERILFGGGTPRAARTAAQAREYLGRALAEVFPALKSARIEHAWRGNVAITADLVPHAGRTPDGIHYALGYCGSGVAMAAYTGAIMGQLMAGAELQSPAVFQLPFPQFRPHVQNRWYRTMRRAYFWLRDRI
jgi:glycine/D-amino acid oxidase-like deaminating enzyme